jgi:16S rRNA (guanine966-N2)-methyltransferase
MRIIAGTARGRTLLAPDGMGTRPMMDIVKGSLFNMLTSLGGIEGRILDLYAGTGSLGLEALSRGAEFVDFVEQNRAAVAILKENIQRLGFDRQAAIHMRQVQHFLASGAGSGRPPYDLVFVDAPYADRVSQRVLQALDDGPLLAADALVCVGHHVQEELPDKIGALVREKFRRFGASGLSIYAHPNLENEVTNGLDML